MKKLLLIPLLLFLLTTQCFAGSTMEETTLKGTKGDTGDTGATGDPGPNQVTTSTTTNITGLLKGASSAVAQAVAATDYASPLGADDNYVTDAEKVVIGNTSNTNWLMQVCL